MQTIKGTLRISADEQRWVDRLGVECTPPIIFIGARVRLVMDLRGDNESDEGELPVYDIGQFSDVAGWYLALDGDFNQATSPIILRNSGIGVETANGKTVLTVTVPDTDSTAMRNALSTEREVSLTLEIGGLDGDGFVVACLQVPLLVRNRIWLGGNVPAEVASDPEYLNAAQVNALVASAVAEAVAEAIEGVSGEDGVSPTISMGTVGNGDTAAVSLVPGANNTYTLNLTLPRGLQGNPGAAGSAPTIAVGTVAEGAEAAATLAADGNGGYALNLTLPRGSGIAYMGLWDAATTYPLNAIVRYNGRLWLALAAGIGKVPGQEAAYWAEAARDGIGIAMRYGHGESGPWHDAPIAAGDTHYCISVDGGANWSRPLPLSQPGVRIAFAYNPDAESDWSEATAGADYSTVTGRWMRLTSSLGVVTVPYDVTGSAGVIAMRLQFDDGSDDWHAVMLPTDTKVRCYTADSSLRKNIDFNLGDGDTPVKLEFSPYADPWHVVYAEGDRFYRTSSDGGETWSDPIPLAMEDAPLDGKFYVRKDGEWVELPASSGSGSGEDGSDTPVATDYAYYGYVSDNTTYAVSQITATMAGNMTKVAISSITNPVTLSSVPAGAVLFVAVPSGYYAAKDDGLGGEAQFEANNGTTGTGANGASTLTIDGVSYKTYGEFRLTTADALIYIQEEA